MPWWRMMTLLFAKYWHMLTMNYLRLSSGKQKNSDLATPIDKRNPTTVACHFFTWLSLSNFCLTKAIASEDTHTFFSRKHTSQNRLAVAIHWWAQREWNKDLAWLFSCIVMVFMINWKQQSALFLNIISTTTNIAAIVAKQQPEQSKKCKKLAWGCDARKA